ncbi:MAG: DUF2934 domain-containing protein [Acidobacteriota bacterium]
MAKRNVRREPQPRPDTSDVRQGTSNDRAPVGLMENEPHSDMRKLEPGAIARRAYELYCERGCEPGRDMDDWLRAEEELRNRK